MELLNTEKESPDSGGGLRLVADNKAPQKTPEIEKQFVNFMFLGVNPEWRKLNSETKKIFKSEFQNTFLKFEDEMMLFTYCMVGFDSKADLMFWRISNSLDSMQEMTSRLNRTNLGSYLKITDNFLSFTKKRMFISEVENSKLEDRFHIIAGSKKYHFLYPCAKESEWYSKSGEEREKIVEENFMVGKRFENIKIHLTHAFGFSDQEFIISFETDQPKDFLALAEEMKDTAANKFTKRGMPVYTCRQRTLMECLDALG